MPSKFTVAAKDTNFELLVGEGAVDVVDSRETGKGRQVTHVGPNMTFSNAGLVQPNSEQSNLSTRQRAAIFIAAGGVLAILFLFSMHTSENRLMAQVCVLHNGIKTLVD